MPRPTRQHAAAVVGAVLAATALAGCGGSSGGHPAPPPRHPSRSASRPGTASPTRTPAPAVRATAAGWRLPSVRSREVVIPHGDTLVVAGGLDAAGTSTADVLSIDPSTGTVTGRGRLARAVHDAAGAHVGGRDVVFGGGAASTVPTVQAVNPAGSGTVIGALPQPRSDLVAATTGGTAYVLGGFDGTTGQPGVLATTDGHTFRRIATLPSSVRYPAVAAVGSVLYVFGGEHDGTAVDLIQRVDTRSGQATVVGHLPHPLAHAAAGVVHGTVLLAGGRSGGQVVGDVWRFDPATASVTKVASLPTPVADAGAAVTSGALWLLGGEAPGRVAAVIRVTVG